MTKDLERTLGRMEANIEEILRRLESYEKRTTKLETKIWTWTGALAVIAIVWGALSDPILKALGFKT